MQFRRGFPDDKLPVGVASLPGSDVAFMCSVKSSVESVNVTKLKMRLKIHTQTHTHTHLMLKKYANKLSNV